MMMGYLCNGMYLQQMSRKALLAHESLPVAGPVDTHSVALRAHESRLTKAILASTLESMCWFHSKQATGWDLPEAVVDQTVRPFP